MKRLFLFISAVILALFLLSCGKEATHRFSLPRESRSGALTGLDSLVDANPDSALKMLDAAIKQEENKIGKSVNRTSVNLMRLELLRAKARNKACVPFRADSLAVMQRVADYYHRKGNANDRMLSLYLLGCAYRDLGSAPRAIETWQQAVAEADTTRSDCDLSTLMRVHSQMEEIYTRMRLPELAKDETEKAKELCWKTKDTLNALLFERKICKLMFVNGQYEECIHKTDSFRHAYFQMGYKNKAALVCVYALKSYLALGEYTKAKPYLDIYGTYCLSEPDHRKINGGLAPYYIYKGNYYFGTGNMDSAEYCFRQALPNKEKGNNALLIYKGLYQVYSHQCRLDSALKYMSLYSDAKEQDFNNATSQAALEAKNLYDYGVEQRIAKEENEAKARFRLGLIIAVVVIVLLCMVIYFGKRIWNRQMKQKEQVLVQEREKVREKDEELKMEKNEKQMFEIAAHETSNLLTSARNTIQKYSEENAILRRKKDKEGEKIKEKLNEIAKSIKEGKKNKKNYVLPFHTALQIVNLTGKAYPNFRCTVLENNMLSDNEKLVCALVKMGMKPAEIESVMRKGQSYAAQTRKRLFYKLFSDEGTPSDFDQRIQSME